jgi:uncharacterized membrane protein YhiD involved in acid resistance
MIDPPQPDGAAENGFLSWLNDAFATSNSDLPFNVLLVRLVVAFVLGCVIAAIYRWTAPSRNRTPSFVPTLVLLTILIAMVTQVIGNSAAKAFTLVGALSIVRFRTNVRDTRDTAFVIFAVIIGMAIGSWHWRVAAVGVPVMAVAARMLTRFTGTPPGRHHWSLTIKVANAGRPVEAVESALPRWFERIHLRASKTVKQGIAVELSYDALPRRDVKPLDCIAGLNAIEGVQGVDLTRL